jgi:hypothetical protein
MVMADAYAVMHWKARVDADDVKFVLWSAPRLRRSKTLEEIENGSYLVSHRIGKTFDDTRRNIGIWLLDFNNCPRITLDANGVEMLVRAFWNNDPYTPRPSADHTLDADLWSHFRQRYLTSLELLGKEDGYLAQLFIDVVEAEGEKWKARRAIAGKGLLFAAIAK